MIERPDLTIWDKIRVLKNWLLLKVARILLGRKRAVLIGLRFSGKQVELHKTDDCNGWLIANCLFEDGGGVEISND